MIKIVVIRETGELALPLEILAESRIQPGTEVISISREGQILILDWKQVRRRMEEIGQKMREEMRGAIERRGKKTFFAGLSLDEYLALSDEKDEALWNRLFKEALGEMKIVEQDIPADFVPARQKRR
jgi:bifunctional DNA-binding transcriptional regulator/antitoxin component of YhaV-PrlF toxin-antitoxin module